MNIIAHRGLWNQISPQNSLQSFSMALDMNFGIELDIRDNQGQIVIAHDALLVDRQTPLCEFLSLYNSKSSNQFLAFNIKSSGLAESLSEIISLHTIQNYAFFDMATPDLLDYIKYDLKVLCRFSEYEQLNEHILKLSNGIWVDTFTDHTSSVKHIDEILRNLSLLRKIICLVSPELHGHKHIETWELYKQKLKGYNNLYLCTDYPDEARSFFK
jgi:hypothetical protein